jgi:hypothetical protein
MKVVEKGKGGSVFEYSEETGLISKDGIVVSGNDYEPVFSSDKEGKPLFCGIYHKSEGRFISLSGNNSSIV